MLVWQSGDGIKSHPCIKFGEKTCLQLTSRPQTNSPKIIHHRSLEMVEIKTIEISSSPDRPYLCVNNSSLAISASSPFLSLFQEVIQLKMYFSPVEDLH